MTRTAKSSAPKARRDEHDDSEFVTEFIRTLEHPMKPVIEALRQTILSADKTITEGIKWNTASFYCHGWFATINIRAKSGVQVVLHQGAKVQDNSSLGQAIKDPVHLLTWLGKDRATIIFPSAEDFKSKQAAFKAVIKQWVGEQKRRAGG